MKKALSVLLMLLLSAFAFAIAFVDADATERERVKALPAVSGEAFSIPDVPGLNDPSMAYAALLEAAVRARVNVVRTNAAFGPDDRPRTTQYVLLTGDTRVFEAFEVTRGRRLTSDETQSGRRFLSTSATSDPDQVGVLRDFGGNDFVAIRPLATAFESLPVTGRYVAESSDAGALDRFFRLLVTRAGPAFSEKDFRGHESAGGIRSRGFSLGVGTSLEVMLYFLVLLTAVFLVYGLLHEAKHVGVMKLHGLGLLRIWFETSGRTIVVTMVGAALVSGVATFLIHDAGLAFLGSVLASLVHTYVVMLAASLVTCLYITRIRLSDTIKNRKDTRGVFAVNTLIKAGCSVVLVVVGTWAWLQYAQIAEQRASLASWEKSSGYAVFIPTYVGNDLTAFETHQPGPTTAEVYDLYPLLNSRGALYIDAGAFETDVLQPSSGGPPPTVTVNPNYLRVYPVHDSSGHIVDVPEETSEWVVLVPEKMRSSAGDIQSYSQEQRRGAPRDEQGCAGRVAQTPRVPQSVRVVWIADGQHIFSFDPKVFPDQKNEIPDPIIEVLTIANSLGCDRANMATGAIGGALKVPLHGKDPQAVLAGLKPDLQRMKLDDNLRHLVTVNEYVLQTIQELRDATTAALTIAAGLLVVLLALAAESLMLGFSMYARRIVVRRLHGIGSGRTYREQLMIFALSWAVQTLAVSIMILVVQYLGVFGGPTASVGDAVPVVASITIVIATTELLFSNAAVAVIERRNLVRVLKGEF